MSGRAPWTLQPQGPLAIDWSNPLTKGLVFCIAPQNRTFDATGRATLARHSTEALTAFPRGGLANRYFNNSFTYQGTTVTGAPTTVGSDGWWMVAVEGVFIVAPGGSSALIQGSASDHRLCFNSSGQAQVVLSASTRVTSTNSVGANAPFRAVFWGQNGGTDNVWLNGVTTSGSDGGFGDLGAINAIGGASGFATNDIAITQVAAWQGLNVARVSQWTADPWQIFRPARKRVWSASTALDTAINPGVGALTLTGFAPTVARTLNQSITPGVGALTLTGFAPTVARTANQAVTPGVGALTLTGFAPTVAQSVNQNITPSVGALTLTGFAPTVAQTANQSVIPEVGALTLTGYAPAVTQGGNQAVTPGVGSLSLVGYAPTVAQSANQAISPAVGALVLTGYAPSIGQTANQAVSPIVGALTLTGYAPSVAQTASQWIVPDVGALVLTGYAPTIAQAPVGSVNITPDPGVLTITGYAPDVTQTVDVAVVPPQISYPKKKRKVYPQPKKRVEEEPETLVEAVAEAIPDTTAQTQELIASVLALEASNERTQAAALQTLVELNARQVAKLEQAIAEAEDEEEVIELLLMA